MCHGVNLILNLVNVHSFIIMENEFEWSLFCYSLL